MDSPHKIKLVVTDVDGVWTDGGLYYDEDGRQFKKFNVKDGAGVKLLNAVGIPVCLITAKNSDMVTRRAREIGIQYVYQGIEGKLSCILGLLEKLQLEFTNVAYIGDDFNDVPVLRKCRISAVPRDASPVIQREAQWIMKKKGGEGVFREFAEKILYEAGMLEKAVKLMIDPLNDPDPIAGKD